MSGHFSDELFSAYFDGEASPKERAEVERLLETSEEARQKLEEYRQISSLLKDLPAQGASRNLSARVMQEVAAELDNATTVSFPVVSSGAKSSRRGRWIIACSLIAAAAALLVMVKLIGPEVESPESVEMADSRLSGRNVAPSDLNTNVRRQENEEVLPSAEGNAKGKTVAEQATTSMRESEKLAAGSRSNQQPLSADSIPLDAAKPPVAALKPSVIAANSPANLAESIPVPGAAGGTEASGLVFESLKDLKDADIGKMVTALEKTNEGVTVVKLTVVDRRHGLESLQVLLSRNNIPLDDEKDGKSADQSTSKKSRVQQKSERLVAVYVETTSRQLSAALSELRKAEQFQKLHVRGPINTDQLNRYSGRRLASGGFSTPGTTNDGSFTSGGAKDLSQGVGGSIKIQIGSKPATGKSDEPVVARKPAGSSDANLASSTPSMQELQRISRQLELSLSPDILTEMAQTTGRTARQFGSNSTNSGGITIRINGRPVQPGAQAKSSPEDVQPEPLKVLFILVVNDLGKPVPTLPTQPGNSDGKSKSKKKPSGNGAA